jgi:hypothetical protein
MLRTEGEAILYRETPLPLGLRLFALGIGLSVGVMVPLPFLIHADWATPSPMLLLAAACIAFPAVVGGFLVIVGLASASELRLDPATGRGERRLRGPILNRHDHFALADLPPPEVRIRASEEGDYPILRVRLPGRRFLDVAGFVDRAEAERWRARIDRVRGVVEP